MRPLTLAGLEAIVADAVVPASLRQLAARPGVQRRIRSATACYLDLGDFAVPVSGGGTLIHVLSDQQWCRHWLAYTGGGGEAVLTTPDSIGFDLADDWPAPPPVIHLDDPAAGLEVCAWSFAEFLYRLWVENEIFFALPDGQPLTAAAAAYAALLPGADDPGQCHDRHRRSHKSPHRKRVRPRRLPGPRSARGGDLVHPTAGQHLAGVLLRARHPL
ncbi:MAG: hypothetical protein ACYCO9_07455 [Streptosporangiaceae bacterium]